MLVIVYWNIFIITALKSFLDNTNLFVILVLSSTVFFIHFEIFLVPSITSTIQVKLGNCGYYEILDL